VHVCVCVCSRVCVCACVCVRARVYFWIHLFIYLPGTVPINQHFSFYINVNVPELANEVISSLVPGRVIINYPPKIQSFSTHNSTIQHNTILHNATQYNTTQYNTIYEYITKITDICVRVCMCLCVCVCVCVHGVRERARVCVCARRTGACTAYGSVHVCVCVHGVRERARVCVRARRTGACTCARHSSSSSQVSLTFDPLMRNKTAKLS